MRNRWRERHGEPMFPSEQKTHFAVSSAGDRHSSLSLPETLLCHLSLFLSFVCFLFCRGSPGTEATDWPDKSSVKSERESYPVSRRKSRSGWILFVNSLTCLWFIHWFICLVSIKRVHVDSVSYLFLAPDVWRQMKKTSFLEVRQFQLLMRANRWKIQPKESPECEEAHV